MRLVIDLDDTISVHKNRDYERAVPIEKTIERMKKLKADGWEIVIYSSRGQASCNGNLELIEARNRKTAEEWLKRNEVPYDQLVFGKPLGDLYVDDKAVSLPDFWSEEHEKLEGNSGAKIYRIGKRVIKSCATAKEEAEWYEEAAKKGLLTPKVNSIVLNTIETEYLEGEQGNKKELSQQDMAQIVSQIMLMSLYPAEKVFDVERYADFIKGRLEIAGWENKFDALFNFIKAHKRKIQSLSSFCHGDLSLSNVIFKDKAAYLIDPSPRREYSSFLIDFAKLRFSLNGGEQLLHGGTRPKEYDLRLSELSEIVSKRGWGKIVAAMEAVHWIRMLRYIENAEDTIWKKAKELEAELW